MALRAQQRRALPLERVLAELSSRGYRLALASNRGPVEFRRGMDGALAPNRGAGGVVTALISVAKSVPMTWISAPMSDEDREFAGAQPDGAQDAEETTKLRFVPITRDAYERYYNVFSNPLLWCLQHYLWDLSGGFDVDAGVYDAWENGYQPVNKAFAEAIVNELAAVDGHPVVLFQDYHLYLAPGYVRQMLPNAFLQHFIHIPFPGPRMWLNLPRTMRLMIIEHMCANDIIGLQTYRDVLNFLQCCEAFLPNVVIDHANQAVAWRGRRTLVREYPISIDVDQVQQLAESPEAQAYIEMLAPLKGEQTIIRVDRLEPSKNIIRGFVAYDALLKRYPELSGKVKFWAFLVPSRTELQLYQDHEHEVMALIQEINQRHGTSDWKPIEVFHENNYTQAIAAMTQYDVLLVNSVMDGMNLVAKEGATVNTRDGVLILSEAAGAHEQLGPYSLSVSPTDLEGLVAAMHRAITMPAQERHAMAQGLRNAVRDEDIASWVAHQLQDILALSESHSAAYGR